MSRLAALSLAFALGLAAPALAQSGEPTGALLQGLDKLTAKTFAFEAPIGRPVRFGRLEVVARACVPRIRTQQPERSAFLEIYEQRPGEPKHRVFSGWMFASAPSISGLEHPVYDVWVVGCAGVEGDSLATDVPRLGALGEVEAPDENAPVPED